MLADDHPARIQITFDDRRLAMASAGLLLPVTLAQHLGLRELVDHQPGPGQCAGAGEPGRQDADPGGVGAGGRRLH